MKGFLVIACIFIASCSPNKMSFIGKAENSELGAVLNQKGRIMYIEGVKSWPEDMVNKGVTVSGKIVEKRYGKEISENDAPVMVIEKPEWKLVE